MTTKQRTGRAILMVFIVLILIVSLGVIALSVAALGTKKLPVQIIRFALTAALCGWLYCGNKVAKWVTVALLSLAGVFALLSLSNFWGDNLVVPIFIGMAVIYLSFSVVLVVSSSVNAFLDYQRGEQSLL